MPRARLAKGTVPLAKALAGPDDRWLSSRKWSPLVAFPIFLGAERYLFIIINTLLVFLTLERP